MRPKAWLSWSSGKDSAWSLQTIRAAGDVEVVALLTTVNTTHSRVAMHAVREELVDQQAAAAGLPLIKIPLPWPCPNEVYEREMRSAILRAREEGVTHMVFGDLFLEDVRRYREDHLAPLNITPLFPLWGRNTAELAEEMIAGGLRAYLTCVDPRKLDPGFAGRQFDASLLRDLDRAAPDGAFTVDHCGENGEFHTFVYAGPMFQRPVPVELGEIVNRDGFTFADLLPAGQAVSPR